MLDLHRSLSSCRGRARAATESHLKACWRELGRLLAPRAAHSRSLFRGSAFVTSEGKFMKIDRIESSPSRPPLTGSRTASRNPGSGGPDPDPDRHRRGRRGGLPGRSGARRPGRARGPRAGLSRRPPVAPLLVGQDPFDRERFWHWMGGQGSRTPAERHRHGPLGPGRPGRRSARPQAARGCPRQRARVRQHLPQPRLARGLRRARARVPAPGLHGLQDPPALLLGSRHPPSGARPALVHGVGPPDVPGRARGGR